MSDLSNFIRTYQVFCIVISIIYAIICSIIAYKKGRNVIGWIFGGAFLGLVGVIIIICLSDLSYSHTYYTLRKENERLYREIRQLKMNVSDQNQTSENTKFSGYKPQDTLEYINSLTYSDISHIYFKLQRSLSFVAVSGMRAYLEMQNDPIINKLLKLPDEDLRHTIIELINKN